MLHRVYTIWDRIAKEAGPLFTAKNDLVAIRNFRIATREVRQDEHLLYYLGEYETELALLKPVKEAVEILVPEEKKDA